ncbi:luciferin 4-monooxygenase-like [Drosophila takahashii]|uniref:luciferin 4-monooxygenase-like n=1 Tax=Drosophila takahashii TaxID=29030 RepID=UPI003898D66A
MRVASYMRSLGLRQSDVVGIMARNTTHIFSVAYACFFNGIAFHGINIMYDRKTIANLYNITKPRLIFCDGDDFEKIREATVNLDVKIVTMRRHPIGSIRIDDVLATPIEDNFQPARLEHGNDQNLVIICSSGTTGTPKALTISNSTKIISVNQYHLNTADVQYTSNNLDWISGILTTITSGVFSTTRIVADNAFDPVLALKIIKEYKVTWVIQAPFALAMMGNCPEFETADLTSLRCYFYGGSRIPVDVENRIRSRLSRDCLHFIYGFMEMGSVVTANFNFDQKPNSVGRLLNGIKLKIINDKGDSLGPEEVGEILINCNQHWSGYCGNPEATLKMQDRQGWYHTADLGYMDKDGFLYIVDRKNDMLKYRSILYYPSEVEAVIAEMSGVSDVCVFGVYDQIDGDKAAANVVRKWDSKIKAQDVVDYVKGRTDSQYKLLNGGVLIVDNLMRSANGKPNRKANKVHYLKVKGIVE